MATSQKNISLSYHIKNIFRTSVFSMDAYILISIGKQQHFLMVPIGKNFYENAELRNLGSKWKIPKCNVFLIRHLLVIQIIIRCSWNCFHIKKIRHIFFQFYLLSYFMNKEIGNHPPPSPCQGHSSTATNYMTLLWKRGIPQRTPTILTPQCLGLSHLESEAGFQA